LQSRARTNLRASAASVVWPWGSWGSYRSATSFRLWLSPQRDQSHPFWRAMRAASTRFAAPSFPMASDR
jgi:hypothetical protein